MYANPRKTTSVKPLGPIDIDALRDAVLAIPQAVWDRENADKPNRFEALDKTQHIVFRFVDKLDDWRQSHDRPMWPQFRSLLEPILAQATRPYGYANGGFPRIMLARMGPGGIIHPHIDASPSAKWPHKIHVPLTTNPGVLFFITPQNHHFPVGHAVEVNNLDVHAVVNQGGSDRIHLIFEYFDRDQPSWLDGAA
jgi:Aspartyl/Asparaginyl beta-hydroxylase